MVQEFPWDMFVREGVGGAVGLGALFLFLKYKPWRNGTHSNSIPVAQRSGDLNPAEWETRIRCMIQEEVQDVMTRNTGSIRRIVKEAVRDTMQYFYGYKKPPCDD